MKFFNLKLFFIFYFKFDSLTLDPDPIGENPGSGSKFRVFGSTTLVKTKLLHFSDQTSGAEVPGSNPASPTMILMHCGIICKDVVTNLWVERETYLLGYSGFLTFKMTLKQ